MINLEHCEYYDMELDCCKKLSDWSEPMPKLAPCESIFCPKRLLELPKTKGETE